MFEIKPNQTVEQYCEQFNNVYNDIPQDIKPSHGLPLTDFPDHFDVDKEYHLRERDSKTLEECKQMQLKLKLTSLPKNPNRNMNIEKP